MYDEMNEEYSSDSTQEEEYWSSIAQKEFWNKSIPVLVLGFLTWGLTSYVFAEFSLNFLTNIGLFIFLMIGYLIVWVVDIVLAAKKKNESAMYVFFLATFLTGMLTAPLFGYLFMYLGVQETTRLFFISTSISVSSLSACYGVGYVMSKKGYHGIHWGLTLGVLGILLLIFAPISFIVLDFNYIMLGFTVLILIWLYASGIFYGMMLSKEIKENAWMSFVLGYFLTLLNIILRLLRIFAEFR